MYYYEDAAGNVTVDNAVYPGMTVYENSNGQLRTVPATSWDNVMGSFLGSLSGGINAAITRAFAPKPVQLPTNYYTTTGIISSLIPFAFIAAGGFLLYKLLAKR
jgi:hypothetical protein